MRKLLFLLLSFSVSGFSADVVPNYFSNNLYERLGVSPNATLKQIKAARNRAIKLKHSDLQGQMSKDRKKEVDLILAKINEAYETLGNKSAREKYDRMLRSSKIELGGGPIRDAGLAPDFYRKERERLSKLKQQYTHLEKVIDNILAREIDNNIPETAKPFFVSPNILPIWPTDDEIVEAILTLREPRLLRALVFSVTTLHAWGSQLGILRRIVDLNEAEVNDMLAEFIFAPHLVNEEGAEVLKIFVAKGFALSVARSLGLAGGSIYTNPDGKKSKGPAWHEHPRGLEIMIDLILVADDQTQAHMDVSFFSESTPWSELVRKDPRFKDLPYLSTSIIKEILVQSGYGLSCAKRLL